MTPAGGLDMRVRGHAARRSRARMLAITVAAITGLALAGLLGAAVWPGAPGALASPVAPAGAGATVPPSSTPVVLEPCLHGGRLTTCWAVRPSNDSNSTLSFNIEIASSSSQVTAFVSGLTRWDPWTGGAARTRCAPACPRLTVSFPPGLWTVVRGVRITLSGPADARYPAGGFRYYSLLRIDEPRQSRHETLAWSWRLNRYTRVSGGLAGIRF
jgi:hypothetical protein